MIELKKRIFYLPNWTMIDEVDILHECHCCDFIRHSGEKAAGLLCIVAYHHKIAIKLEEYGSDLF